MSAESVEKPLFSISPLFYDALSQEFTPSTDLRRHTMGRLAVATVLKGTYELVEFKDGWQTNDFALFTYHPSWAPKNVCRVEAYTVTGNHAVIHSLHLHQTEGSRSLSIVSPLGKYAEGLGISQDDGVTTTYELELGDKLYVAREAIAAAAEAFFEG